MTNRFIFATKHILRRIFGQKPPPAYPICGGYSDIFIVSSATIKQFADLCGAFAATRLFVEVAIPTALVLATEKDGLVIEKTKIKTLWGQEEVEPFETRYQSSLSHLLDNFPEDTLAIHPIKLSQWR